MTWIVTVPRPYVPGAREPRLSDLCHAAMHLIRGLEAMAGNPFPSRLFENLFSVPEDLTM